MTMATALPSRHAVPAPRHLHRRRVRCHRALFRLELYFTGEIRPALSDARPSAFRRRAVRADRRRVGGGQQRRGHVPRRRSLSGSGRESELRSPVAGSGADDKKRRLCKGAVNATAWCAIALAMYPKGNLQVGTGEFQRVDQVTDRVTLRSEFVRDTTQGWISVRDQIGQ
jgi:hypothetical protein